MKHLPFMVYNFNIINSIYLVFTQENNGRPLPGGRLRIEMLIDLVKYNCVDLSRLVTHVFHGFDHIEEALLLMKDKPKDLIKPVVILEK